MANLEVELVELVDDIEEEEETEPDLTPAKISEAVVYSTDWTVETILSQLKRKNIAMPEFQRRDAWAKRRKSRYIESLILSLPVPQIILADRKDKKGSYLVLDGKQRLLSLLQFIGADGVSKNNNFRLQGLEVLKNLNGKTFNDIESDATLVHFLDPFYNQTIHSVVIRNWPAPSFLHMLFIRFNSETLPLSPQELRQALFPGDFVKYADEAARKSQAIRILLGLKSDELDLRMRDVELLVRYLAFAFYLSDHRGNLKKFLDDTCEKLNGAWQEKGNTIKNQVSIFEQAVETAIEIFGERNIARKWTEEGEFGVRLNKAILDVIVFYFSDERIRRIASEKAPAVLEAFKRLCLESEDFRNSIETTTKSLSATSTRLSLWGNRLRDVLDLDFQIPTLKHNRIKFISFW